MSLYLTGSVGDSVRPLLDSQRIGCLNTPNTRYRMGATWIWAADNGCFGNSYVGDEKWFAWLASFDADARNRCLFATAPDVVGDSVKTLERSRPWLARIRSVGYRAAFVAQDGLTIGDAPWAEFDALFIGGTTKWKLSAEAYSLIAEARKRGKLVHVGRVNSRRRYLAMAYAGADSVDGTFLAFGPEVNAKRLVSWLTFHDENPPLFNHTV